KSVRKGLSPNPFSASLSQPSKPSHPMTETSTIKDASVPTSTTKTQKLQRQPVSTKCVANKMNVFTVKEHLKVTISTLLLKRTAAEYGCTPTHLWRVLRKSKQSSKLLLWLTDNHPELLTAKTQKREDAKSVRDTFSSSLSHSSLRSKELKQ
ncbi:MAG: hypothetical protein Q4F99_07340, partial [bacterium]|nr:hypothetical protein [bacterium]